MSRLSVIILSYNTASVTKRCLESLFVALRKAKGEFEVIVVENGSTDDSYRMLASFSKTVPEKIRFILKRNDMNVGFTKGNNQGLNVATGRYVLFLNSDVLVGAIDFDEVLKFLDEHESVGALTVAVRLEENGLDMASHRGFPTLWNSFCYFSKLEAITASLPLLNRVFGGYHLTAKDMKAVHEVDAISGAFFLSRRDLLLRLKGFDEDFFMYGEDIDLSFRIKEKNFSVIYYPGCEVIHLKYQSGLKTGDAGVKEKTKNYFYEAMKIFFKKHYAKNYPAFVTPLVEALIDLKKHIS